MRAEDLRMNELIRFEEGMFHLHGRRHMVFDVSAMGFYTGDVTRSLGEEETRRLMTRMGFFWGHSDAEVLRRGFEWDDLSELLRAGTRMLMLHGLSRAEFLLHTLDEPNGVLDCELLFHESAEVAGVIQARGRTDKPVCWVQAAHASGYFSSILGRDIRFLEQTCRARGDDVCRAVGKDVDSWGAGSRVKMRYFTVSDIKSKIRSRDDALDAEQDDEADRRHERFQILEESALTQDEIRSSRFQKIMELAERVARFDSSILITGETGVGKEVLARHIHRLSPRSDAPFVVVNCAALTETLLESELFGHKKGAFTGATADRHGLFEEAEGGILFLDEIGEISPGLQSKLLRALQNHSIRRLGDTITRHIDVRIIAATNSDLQASIEAGSFRIDLYYRLNVIHMDIPPLRERPEDIMPLARKFLRRFARGNDLPDAVLDSRCVDILTGYHWPGNIRELQNAIEHAAVISNGGTIYPEHLPVAILTAVGDSPGPLRTLRDVEARHIGRILKQTGGNRARAADILGISQATLYRRLAEQRGDKKE